MRGARYIVCADSLSGDRGADAVSRTLASIAWQHETPVGGVVVVLTPDAPRPTAPAWVLDRLGRVYVCRTGAEGGTALNAGVRTLAQTVGVREADRVVVTQAGSVLSPRFAGEIGDDASVWLAGIGLAGRRAEAGLDRIDRPVSEGAPAEARFVNLLSETLCGRYRSMIRRARLGKSLLRTSLVSGSFGALAIRGDLLESLNGFDDRILSTSAACGDLARRVERRGRDLLRIGSPSPSVVCTGGMGSYRVAVARPEAVVCRSGLRRDLERDDKPRVVIMDARVPVARSVKSGGRSVTLGMAA